MLKKRNNKNRGLVRMVHIQAVFLIAIYAVLSKYVFVKSLASSNFAVNFLIPYFYGVIGGSVFLYLFSHEDFFHFIKEIEKIEKKKENSYLKKYIHYGKILSTLIIAAVGGPIFSALTIRLLLNSASYKYILLAFGNVSSTLISVTLGLGVWKLIF